jgi:hypothetical protein
MLADDPALRDRLQVHVVGRPSGSVWRRPRQLEQLAAGLGIADLVRFLPPQPPDGWPSTTGPPTSPSSPATTSPSAWWPWRRRPAGRRSSRPPSAACARPSATASPASWSRAATRRLRRGHPRGARPPRAAVGRCPPARRRLLLGPHRRRRWWTGLRPRPPAEMPVRAAALVRPVAGVHGDAGGQVSEDTGGARTARATSRRCPRRGHRPDPARRRAGCTSTRAPGRWPGSTCRHQVAQDACAG